MKSLILLVLFLPIVVFSGEVRQTTLNNGLKIIVKPDTRAPIFISQLWYKVGGSDESRPTTGVSHMLEHIMFKGTKKYPKGEFSRIIAANGGTENAFTSKDYTAYYQKMHQSKLALAIQMEADRMRHLTFSETELQKEREVVIEERSMRIEDNPNAKVYEKLHLISFSEKGAYHSPVIGFQADLDAYKLKDLQTWYRRFYAPNNATLVVVGNVSFEEVVALAKRYFSDYKPVDLNQRNHPSVALNGNAAQLKLKAKLAFYAMNFHAPSLKTAKNNEPYQLEMLAYVLDNILSKTLIREKQIIASIGVGYQMYDKYNTTFNISFVPAKGVLVDKVLQNIKLEIAKIIANPKGFEDILTRTKAQLEAGFVYQQDSISTQAYYLGMLETVGLGWEKMFEYLDKMNEVEAIEVANVAKKYLDFKKSNAVELIPQVVE
jgi:zinc protease